MHTIFYFSESLFCLPPPPAHFLYNDANITMNLIILTSSVDLLNIESITNPSLRLLHGQKSLLIPELM